MLMSAKSQNTRLLGILQKGTSKELQNKEWRQWEV